MRMLTQSVARVAWMLCTALALSRALPAQTPSGSQPAASALQAKIPQQRGAKSPQAKRRKHAKASAGKPRVHVRARTDSLLAARWPVKSPPLLNGALLPKRRIIAFYGTPASKRMGILGELPPKIMLAQLDAEVARWRAADRSVETVPALHLIAVVAQHAPGRDGKYRRRTADTTIQRVLEWAAPRHALVFLDIQLGRSTLAEELPHFEKFLKRPDVHLGIDPEFAMSATQKPGRNMGAIDAADVNTATQFLTQVVNREKLPPKILVLHRFTRKGIKNAQRISLDARVQIVVSMDGFGSPSLKKRSYHDYVLADPVEFAGWKQFYKNDKPRTAISVILKLWPVPFYIQYQ